jgi:filamentous hemagglutinin
LNRFISSLIILIFLLDISLSAPIPSHVDNSLHVNTKTLILEEQQFTLEATVISQLTGLTPETSELIYAGVNIGAGVGVGIKTVGSGDSVGSIANEANSAKNVALLKMQLSAEEISGTKLPTQITSYSQHAIEQIAGRDGGKGVGQAAISSAWSNPLKIEYVPTQYGPTFRYTGTDAVVVVNAEGKVVTAWAKSSSGTKQ